jgi:hypothetical protein
MKTKQFILAAALALAPSITAATAQPATREEEQRLQEKYSAYQGVSPDYVHAGESAVERWMDLKWGLRIHWGLYTLWNGGESWIIRQHVKDQEWQRNYYASYQNFNPTNFNADEWMEIMQHSGMKFL